MMLRWKLGFTRPNRFFICAASLFCIIVYIFLVRLTAIQEIEYPHAAKHLTRELIGDGCHRQELKIMDPNIVKHLKDVPPVRCSPGQDWLYVFNGSIYFNKDITKDDPVDCRIMYMKRLNDFKSITKKEVQFNNKEHPKLDLEEDFFWADCINHESKASWFNVMAGIHSTDDHHGPSDSTKLNILMVGFDSLSRLHFRRKLSKSFKYLNDTLNAFVLKGYSILGDGTPQAVIPILTGYTEMELPETRKRKSDAHYVNVFPFIWKNFSRYNYITAFAEDSPSVGTFTYRLKGFDQLPTTHYMRQFYVEAEKEFKKHQPLCLGSLPRHVIFLNWLKEIFTVYPKQPKFVFGFHGELSHDDFNLVQVADNDLEDWLRKLKESNVLNNTILIVMSDHGNRFGAIRETQQGKLEERNPFFSFVLPPWFEKKFPRAFSNLKENSENRLLTPFDIHETFEDIILYFNHGNDVPLKTYQTHDFVPRSFSLFSNIPKERSCYEAQIEPHWCTCLQWVKVDVNDPIVIQAAIHFVDFSNDLTKEIGSKCATLTMDRVLSAEIMVPNKELMAFKKSQDYDGFVADLTGKSEVTDVIYQLQLTVLPSQAKFEISIIYNLKLKTFSIEEGQVSRINMYGETASCVIDSHPHLRKYCFCQ